MCSDSIPEDPAVSRRPGGTSETCQRHVSTLAASLVEAGQEIRLPLLQFSHPLLQLSELLVHPLQLVLHLLPFDAFRPVRHLSKCFHFMSEQPEVGIAIDGANAILQFPFVDPAYDLLLCQPEFLAGRLVGKRGAFPVPDAVGVVGVHLILCAAWGRCCEMGVQS